MPNKTTRQAQNERSSRPADATAAPDGTGMDQMRIAKAMARAGLCSRRDAERWIAEGRVAVNGHVINSPAINVGGQDAIVVDGKALPRAEPVRLWRYCKPRGRVTTHKDPQGRPTVFEALPDGMPRVVSIGRLDFNTEGLLLLTNDGALARHLELPSTGWLRRYRVRAHGRVSEAQLKALANGVEVEGVRYGPIVASLDREQGSNIWLTLGLREGKNREVRRVLQTLDLDVTRLIRISFGPFMLGELQPGQTEEVAPRVLAEQLGTKLGDDLGLGTKTSRERAKPQSQDRDKPPVTDAAHDNGRRGRKQAKVPRSATGAAPVRPKKMVEPSNRTAKRGLEKSRARPR